MVCANAKIEFKRFHTRCNWHFDLVLVEKTLCASVRLSSNVQRSKYVYHKIHIVDDTLTKSL